MFLFVVAGVVWKIITLTANIGSTKPSGSCARSFLSILFFCVYEVKTQTEISKVFMEFSKCKRPADVCNKCSVITYQQPSDSDSYYTTCLCTIYVCKVLQICVYRIVRHDFIPFLRSRTVVNQYRLSLSRTGWLRFACLKTIIYYSVLSSVNNRHRVISFNSPV